MALQSTLADIATVIDASISEPVLVVGSPPPAGRDLDVLARPCEYRVIAALLEKAGFVRWCNSWALFEGSRLVKVDLACTDDWGVDDCDPGVLFRDADALPGCQRVMRPAPFAVLLLAARGVSKRRAGITPKVRGRVFAALERDPDAWATAEGPARQLRLAGALQLLRRAYESERPLPRHIRAVGLAGLLVRKGSAKSKATLVRELRPRQWRPTIVSFSGLDGAGKSTQVAALSETLQGLGIHTDAQWAGAKTGSRMRAALPFLDWPAHAGTTGDQRERVARDPLVPSLCLRHPAAQQLWLTHVVAVNCIALWRHVLRRWPGPKVLIFDRFTPDTAVKIDFRYRLGRGFDTRWAAAVFAWLSPKPDAGFLVAVPSAVAWERRHEGTLEDLETFSRIYEQQVARFDLIRLDGTSPPEELRRDVARAVWRGLR